MGKLLTILFVKTLTNVVHGPAHKHLLVCRPPGGRGSQAGARKSGERMEEDIPDDVDNCDRESRQHYQHC